MIGIVWSGGDRLLRAGGARTAEAGRHIMGPLGKTHKDLQETFTGRISRRLSLLLGLILVVVLLVGGISLLLARAIYVSTETIERQGRHVETIDTVHAAVHHLTLGAQQTIITGIPPPEDEQRRLIGDLKVLIAQYTELEMEEGDFPGKEREMTLFVEIGENIAELLSISDRLFNAAARAEDLDQRNLGNLTAINARIHILADEMNEIHRSNITGSIEEGRKMMWVILGFYLAFIIIGTLLIIGSNLVFYKRIVLPIRRLAAATGEVARGDFRKRVSVISRDELGQLAHSFNVMAERLEDHEKTLETLATERERERIAREMHDGLAQALGYLHMHLGSLEARISPGAQDGIRDELREMKKMAGEAYEEVRQSIFGLRTMVSRGLGLIPSLTEYLHDFSQQTGIPVELQIGDSRATTFSPEVEVQLVRIIQEALANIRKHAGATHAVVRLDVEGDRCCVTVRDDGRGFDPGVISNEGSRHFGLQSMRERAEGIAGSLEIETAPGMGTVVLVRVPI